MSALPSPTIPTPVQLTAGVVSWPKHRATRADRAIKAGLRQRDTARRLDAARHALHTFCSRPAVAVAVLGAGTILTTVAGVTLTSTGWGF